MTTVTTDVEKIRLIEQIKADLRKKAVIISPQTIELVIDAYVRRTSNP